jgi:hypothetical protein
MGTRLFIAASLAGVVACGGAPKPAESPTEPQVAAKPQPRKGGASVSQELGEIDPQEADKAFGRLQGKLLTCHKNGLGRIDPLGGDVKFFVRIGQDGKTRYTYLEESTLGDLETERCMLEAVQQASWPEPKGGEAEARKAYGFHAGDVREPTAWTADKVTPALAKRDAEVKKCVGASAGAFTVTMYVEPDGKEGKVLGVGVATKDKDAASKVPCLSDTLRSLKLPSPGSYMAKVTFSL